MSEFLERIQKLSPQRLALLAIELNSRLEDLEQGRRDPIAVIGLGCRFPGGVVDAESYWQLLGNGVDAIQEIPTSRWDVNAYYDPDVEQPGKISTRWGGFVDNFDQFDAQFFGITPREALTMDPQQRLVLEVAWETFENGGYAPDRLTGSPTGVFLGACNNDYYQILQNAGAQYSDMYLSTGNAHSVISGRVSYVLGLRGPSLTVDTACSSSLVAIHLAYLSLRKGECRMAIAGGVNTILSPETSIALSRAKMMAADGRCKAFDAAADGFVRSEGCGLVLMKRLSEAVADGDRILALIRGSATNQDGRSNGLTAPNGPSQVAVIRAALEEAGLTPADVQYVETHGTGTSLGDPIEVQALGEALGPGHSFQQPLMIGSVKTNIGHLESAAGIAGLIKLILSLQHRQIPPHLHLNKPNPYIAWDQLPIVVPTHLTDWQAAHGRWIGGVSSFGFSGTNVHLILERAAEPILKTSLEERPLHILALSARGNPALQAQAARLADFLTGNPGSPVESVIYSQNTGRGTFANRLALRVSDTSDAHQKLAEAARQIQSGEKQPTPVPNLRPQVVFLYTGSGAQWSGVGIGLYRTQPVFRNALQTCEELFRPHLAAPLLSVMFPQADDPVQGNSAICAQASTFAIEYALAELWKSWGVTPDAVLGHSLGEYAAAVEAGVFSLEDGVRLVAARGRLLDSITEPSATYSVFATAKEAETVLAGLRAKGLGEVAIAAIDGPQNTVISGGLNYVEEAVARFAHSGVQTRQLALSQAYHSPLIDPILDEFERTAAGTAYSKPQIDLVSCLFGRQVEANEVTNAAYWRRHLREPVQFLKGIQALHSQRAVLVEVGPHPVLISIGQLCFAESDALWLPSLREHKDDWTQILESLGAAWEHGVDVDWRGFDRPYARQRLALPPYPFQRQRYWASAGMETGREPAAIVPQGSHALLQRPVRSPALSGTVFETRLSQDSPPFLEHHRIFGEVILPSPVYIEMALTAAEETFGPGSHRIENLSVQSALLIPEHGQRTVQIILKTVEDGRSNFEVHSFDESQRVWMMHASGEIIQQDRTSAAATEPLFQPDEVLARCQEEIQGTDYYARLADLGLEFGPWFQGIEHVWRRDGEALGKLRLPEDLAGESGFYHFHPAFLDACFHLLGAPLPEKKLEQAYLLIGMDRFQLFRKPGRMLWNHTVLFPQKGSGQEIFSATCRLYDTEGHLVAEASGLMLKRAGREALLRSINKQVEPEGADWLYRIAWQPMSLPGVPATLPSASQLAENLSPVAARHEADPDYAAYARLSTQLDAYCVAAIDSAFERLNFPLVTGRRFTTAEFIREAEVLPLYSRLAARLVEILGTQGLLAQDGNGWRVVRRAPEAVPAEELCTAFPAYSSEVSLLSRCAEALPHVLTGKQDALALLFPGGSLEATEALYSRSPYARAFNQLIAEVVPQRIPGQGRLRVLEIGAGSGSTTALLLPLLPAARSEYVFSDLSELFLKKARSAFAVYPFVRYQVFDVERDPQTQGLADQKFDIVLAANVLHATADLRRSLAHVRQLLAPGGLLLLLESTRKESWVDLTFGLTEGWWGFQDTQIRPDHPVLAQSQWLDLLKETGFREAATLPTQETGTVSGQALLIAQPDPPESGGLRQAPAGWLVFHDPQTGAGTALADTMRREGQRCILVSPSLSAENGAVQTGDDCWEIAPDDPGGYADVLNLAVTSDRPIRTVVDLWSPSPDPHLPDRSEALCVRALHLTKALQALPQPDRPSLWFATFGAQAVNGTLSADGLPASALWGFGRTVALEHPEFWGGLIDLDPAEAIEDSMAHLLGEIRLANGEDQVGYRSGQRYAARLVRTQPPALAELKLHKDNTYLITGGLGGLGIKVAAWMVQQGARHLVLTGRRGLPAREQWDQIAPDSDLARKVSAIKALEEAGAQVCVSAVDTTDEATMRQLFQSFGTSLPALGGIVHAAADLSNSTLREMENSTLHAMLHPKVHGTWVLHCLSQGIDLDFFVLFSSTTSLLGSQNLGHYAAANSFLDSFAHYRKAIGLPAVSINWGTWDTMRVATQAEQQRVAQFGLQQMNSDRALSILGSIIANHSDAQVTVAAVDWDALKPAYEARRRKPLLEGLRNRPSHSTPMQRAVAKPSGPELPRMVLRLPPEERYNVLVRHVRGQVAAVIGSTAPESIDVQQGLFEMGLDSLMSVDLQGKLESGLGQSLPSTLTFNYPTVAELAEFLLERISQVETPPATATAPAPARAEAPGLVEAHADDFDDLTEDELASLLSKKLKGGA